MAKIPNFSILMCVYNGADFVEEAIVSILSQSYTDFELVIVDDGSTDSTQEICYGFCKQDSRVKYFYKENSGLTSSLNYGLGFCTGHWIVRQDADDISSADRLLILSQYAADDYDFIFSQSIGFYDGVENSDQYVFPRRSYQYGFCYSVLKFGNFLAHGSICVRSGLLRANKYNEKYSVAQDFELYLRLLKAEVKAVFVPYPLYKLRLSAGSISAKNREKQVLMCKQALLEHFGCSFYYIDVAGPLFSRVWRKVLRELYLFVSRSGRYALEWLSRTGAVGR